MGRRLIAAKKKILKKVKAPPLGGLGGSTLHKSFSLNCKFPINQYSPLSVSPKQATGRESDGARGRYELTGRGLANCGLESEK